MAMDDDARPVGGDRPEGTPRPVALMKRILALEGLAQTHGRSWENVHVSPDFAAALAPYRGTRLGRQELEGELIEDVAGSLWPRALIEASRVREAPRDGYARVVVGVDPPASAEGVCGICVCVLGRDGLLYVLADASVEGASPEQWARAVAHAAELWGADRVAAEVNNGGDMVTSVLRRAAPALPVRPVHASRGKVARAEPAAAAFERREARFAGCFPELEDQLTGMTQAGGYEGPGRSPDRADAMVWAMTKLMQPARALPSIRAL